MTRANIVGANTMNKWYIKFPGDVYAMGPIDFPADSTEKDVREYAREFDGCKRLPAGFECWRATT